MKAKEPNELAANLKLIPTPYHFVEYAKKQLTNLGYVELLETNDWDTIPNKFFVIRNNSSIFAINKADLTHGLIIKSNSDSPCFRCTSDLTSKIRTIPTGEIYASTWVDRDLKIAGRAKIKEGDKRVEKLFYSTYPCAKITSCGLKISSSSPLRSNYNIETSFTALNNKFYLHAKNPITKLISSELNCTVSDLIDTETYFVDSQEPSIIGIDETIFASSRIDNLVPSLCALEAFLQSAPKTGLIGLVIFGNIHKNFVPDVLHRVGATRPFMANTTFLALRCFNAYHPNYNELFNEIAKIRIGDGIVFSRNNCDIRTVSKIKECAMRHGIEMHESDEIETKNETEMKVMEIGIPILARHSARETCAVDDIGELKKLLCNVVNEF